MFFPNFEPKKYFIALKRGKDKGVDFFSRKKQRLDSLGRTLVIAVCYSPLAWYLYHGGRGKSVWLFFGLGTLFLLPIMHLWPLAPGEKDDE